MFLSLSALIWSHDVLPWPPPMASSRGLRTGPCAFRHCSPDRRTVKRVRPPGRLCAWAPVSAISGDSQEPRLRGVQETPVESREALPVRLHRQPCSSAPESCAPLGFFLLQTGSLPGSDLREWSSSKQRPCCLVTIVSGCLSNGSPPSSQGIFVVTVNCIDSW